MSKQPHRRRNRAGPRPKRAKEPEPVTPLQSQSGSAAADRCNTAIVIVLIIIGSAAIWTRMHRSESSSPTAQISPITNVTAAAKLVTNTEPAPPPSSSSNQPPISDNFLDGFLTLAPDGNAKAAATGTIHNNEMLETRYQEMLAAFEERRDLEDQMMRSLKQSDSTQTELLQMRGRELNERFNTLLSKFEGELKNARTARPDAAIIQWLTGELLQYVGGEPAETLPYFERAVKAGLQRPHLLASLARARFEANQFTNSLAVARQALALAPTNRYAWETYGRIALGNEQFDDVLRRLEQSFPPPVSRPAWTVSTAERAARLATAWRAESTQREAERAVNNLPRVRLLVRHRHYARDAQGSATSRIEITGDETIELELFEDQAPLTVANFIHFVESGFYDGTSFFVAEAATHVRAGDPNTRNNDPSDDSEGGPGYTIPDEFDRPDARPFFRGTIGMVNTGPGTAGSQFFITLVPFEQFNGHFTVFGRVASGQAAVDAITIGRTSPEQGHFGRLIPGDLLVRAQVLRKWSHPYLVTRNSAPTNQ